MNLLKKFIAFNMLCCSVCLFADVSYCDCKDGCPCSEQVHCGCKNCPGPCKHKDQRN